MKFIGLAALLAVSVSGLKTVSHEEQQEHEFDLGSLSTLSNLAGGGSSGLGGLGSLFGGSSQPSSGLGGLFGGSSQPSSGLGGLFGGGSQPSSGLGGLFGGSSTPTPSSSSGGLFSGLFGGSSTPSYGNPNTNSGSSSGGLFGGLFGGSKPQPTINPQTGQQSQLSKRGFMESFESCCKRQPGGMLCGRTTMTSSCCTNGYCSGFFVKTCSDKFQIHACDLI